MQNNELFCRIEKLRIKSNLSQSAISVKTGVSKSFYSEMKAGRTGPSVTFIAGLFKISRNLNPLWLFFGEGNMFLQNEGGNYLRENGAEYGHDKDKPIYSLSKRLAQCSENKQRAIVGIIEGLLQLIDK